MKFETRVDSQDVFLAKVYYISITLLGTCFGGTGR